MSKKFHRDVWVGLVLLLFCAAVLVNAVQISGQAAYLPVALTVLMAVCAVFIILKGLRLTKEQMGEYSYPLTVKNSKYAFLFMFFIFIYYLGFRYITYCIATPIFMLYTILAFIVFVVILHLPIYKIGILGRFFRYL